MRQRTNAITTTRYNLKRYTMTTEQLQQMKDEVFDALWRQLPPISKQHPRNRGNRIPQNQIKQECARELMQELDDADYERLGSVKACVDSLLTSHWIENL